MYELLFTLGGYLGAFFLDNKDLMFANSPSIKIVWIEVRIQLLDSTFH
jgi:hypothetical protein